MIRKLLVGFNGVLVVGVVLGLIIQKERVLSDGQQVFLELAPVDPRSLMQGDYMRLDYAVAREVDAQGLPDDGLIYISLDQQKIASLSEKDVLGAVPIRYRRRDLRVRVGTDAFYFEEGTAESYTIAKYGELRLDSSGNSVLVGLRDEQLRVLPQPVATQAAGE